jgi:hypothetical protein
MVAELMRILNRKNHLFTTLTIKSLQLIRLPSAKDLFILKMSQTALARLLTDTCLLTKQLAALKSG